ncbi:MAG: ferredoxin [Acidimicrobiia bacterium]
MPTRKGQRFLLTVDPGACTGHGRCYSLVPELFEPDDRGDSVVKAPEIDEGHLDEAERAVAACPEQAIGLAAAGEGDEDGDEGEGDT